MCGICGIVRFDGQPIEPRLFDAMRASLFHRGPDDYGQYINGPVGLANLRLSIIDLQTGRQPIFNEDCQRVIVYNGEVYNYQSLRNQLRQHQFVTHSDTESILHAYDEWGLDCLPLLNGMFAFAIWDETAQALVLARDRIGIKPLYYTIAPNYFAFASEIKALLSAELVTPNVNVNALGTYLAMKYVPSEETLFKDVYRLLPGQWLKITPHKSIVSGKFWDFHLEPDNRPRPAADYAAELREIVATSISDQLVADVPVGAFLSGGLDSGIVVTEIARQKGKGVKAFTIDYESAKPEQNETFYARTTVNLAGALHRTVTCTSAEAQDLTALLTYHLDEPLSEPLLAPSFLLAQAARKDVAVVLTGEGGDELFAGYSRYKLTYWVNKLQSIPLAIRRGAMQIAVDRWGRQDLKSRVLRASIDPESVRDWHLVFIPEEIKALTGQLPVERGYTNSSNLLDSLMEMDTCFRLPEYILTRVDKMTMANSLEARVPLLDNRVVEFARRLPSQFKLRDREEKFILREAFRTSMPSEIVRRPKVAFSAPYEAWLPKLYQTYLHDSHLVQAGLLFNSEIIRLLEGDPFYRGRHAEKLWTLIILEIWYRVFIDRTLIVQPSSSQRALGR